MSVRHTLAALLRRPAPTAAPPGRYHARLGDTEVLVTGPRRLYPSGLPYYTRLDQPGEHIPASRVQHVRPALRRNPRQRPAA